MQKLRRFRDHILAVLWFARYKDRFHQRGIRRVLSLNAEEKKRRGITRTVRLVSNAGGMWNFALEQTPQQSCQWGHTLFVGSGPADHYVAITALPKASAEHPALDFNFPVPERLWYWQMEPEQYVRDLGYDDPAAHALASRYYTNCDFQIARGGIYRAMPPYVFWLLVRSWDWLKRAEVPKKSSTVGLICSGLQHIAGHFDRWRFLEKLDESNFGGTIWGRGNNLEQFKAYRGFAPSKWRVHANCRYSIVMENTVSDWYWSEKIADSLLAWSVPLYYGCPKIFEYFPEESIIPIDIRDPDCVKQIRFILAKDNWEKRLTALREARRLLLEKHNFFAVINKELNH